VIARKTSVRLSDGRELIYYDDESLDADRGAADTRDLGLSEHASQLRYDPLLDEWVIVASHRQSRTHRPPTNECPLDPSTPERATEIPASGYDVVVFENRFPSLSGSRVESAHLENGFTTRPGIGRCEVVCFTSDHNAAFVTLSTERARTVLDVLADRTVELGAIPGVEHVFPFENRGEEIGVTLHHPHGQVYAFSMVPPKMEQMLANARSFWRRDGGCLFCSAIEHESKSGTRVIAETQHVVAFVPYAARWPFEVHVYAKRHVPDLASLTAEERTELADLHLDVLRRVDGVFGPELGGGMPYISAWMQAPVRIDRDLGHLHAQVFSSRRAPGKLKYLAGIESGAWQWTNDVAPEEAARMLRGVRTGAGRPA